MWVVFTIAAAIAAASVPPSSDGSRVTAAEAEVFETPSAASQVLRTLTKGEVVVVDFRVDGEQGKWCALRSPAAGQRGGYVPCSRLEDPGVESAFANYRPSVPEPSVKRASAPAVRRTEPPPAPEAWSSALGMAGNQRQRAVSLLQTTGVAGCRNTVSQQLRSIGVWDTQSLTAWMKRPNDNIKSIQAAQVGEALAPCVPRYRAFWSEFDGLLTAEQRKVAWENPWYLLLRSTLKSEPEVVIFSDVTRHMRR
jgi:hypothetical protein